MIKRIKRSSLLLDVRSLGLKTNFSSVCREREGNSIKISERNEISQKYQTNWKCQCTNLRHNHNNLNHNATLIPHHPTTPSRTLSTCNPRPLHEPQPATTARTATCNHRATCSTHSPLSLHERPNCHLQPPRDLLHSIAATTTRWWC